MRLVNYELFVLVGILILFYTNVALDILAVLCPSSVATHKNNLYLLFNNISSFNLIVTNVTTSLLHSITPSGNQKTQIFVVNIKVYFYNWG